MNRLQEKYQKEIKNALKSELELANIHQVPAIDKIVVNAGVGRATQDTKHLDVAVKTITQITAQKPVITKARNSIAAYKLREGNPIGVKVTLRGERMWDFLDRLIAVVLPRTRDFRGLPAKSFDPQGNYSIGLRDQTVFPEINFEDASATHGLQLTLVTTTTNKDHAEALLRKLGLPLEKGK